MTAALGEDVRHRRRRGTIPRSIIDGMRPELVDPDPLSALLQNRRPGLVTEDPGIAVDLPKLQIVKRRQPPGDTLNP